MINSAIYNGHVVHKRFKPKVHYFKYKVFSLLIDLSELEIFVMSIVNNKSFVPCAPSGGEIDVISMGSSVGVISRALGTE